MRNRVITCWLVAGMLAAMLPGCSPGNSAAGKKPVALEAVSGSSISIVLSGDTGGFIVPCGCATKQFGGLPRRGTYIQGTRSKTSDRLVYLDAGGSVHRATDYDALKLEYIWSGMAAMKPAAMNLGAGEVLLGAKQLRRLAREGVPLLSSNVKPTDGDAAWKDRIRLQFDGRRIAIVGVCVPPAKVGPGLEVVDPTVALRGLVPRLARSCDAVVLLVYGKETDCIKLVDEFPELNAVFAAGTGQPIKPRMIHDRTIFASTAVKGKFLARIDAAIEESLWRMLHGEIVELSEDFADEKIQVENLDAYKARLKKELLDPSRTGEAPRFLSSLGKEYQYAGNASCISCHEAETKVHKKSKHSHGLETLAAKGFQYDPYCLKCHTTGYGGPGGFKTAAVSESMGGIGCESCHGPSKAHVLASTTKTMVKAKESCVTCHDPENSPKFDYAEYWPKIEHKKEKRKAERSLIGNSVTPVGLPVEPSRARN